MEQDYKLVGTGSLGITGHRPSKLGGYNDYMNLSGILKLKMEMFFTEKNPYKIVTGMAQGVDQWAAEVALKMGIQVLALLPCTGQESKWPIETQQHYCRLLDRILVAGGQSTYVSLDDYTPTCMHRRNQEIVTQSSELFAVWDGTRGGTRDCVRLALSVGIPVTVLHPRTLEFSKLEKQ